MMGAEFSGERSDENGDGFPSENFRGFKRRCISAIREFPPRCGPRASEIDGESGAVDLNGGAPGIGKVGEELNSMKSILEAADVDCSKSRDAGEMDVQPNAEELAVCTVDGGLLPARNSVEIDGKLGAMGYFGERNVLEIDGESSSGNLNVGANHVGCLVGENVTEINGISSNKDVNGGAVDATSLPARNVVEIDGKLITVDYLGDCNVVQIDGNSSSENLKVGADNISCLVGDNVVEFNGIRCNKCVNHGAVDVSSLPAKNVVEIDGKLSATDYLGDRNVVEIYEKSSSENLDVGADNVVYLAGENVAEINGIPSNKDVNYGTVDPASLPARNLVKIDEKLSAMDCFGDQNVVQINGKSSSEDLNDGANEVGCLVGENVAEINGIPSNKVVKVVNDGAVDATSLPDKNVVEIDGKLSAMDYLGDQNMVEINGKSSSHENLNVGSNNISCLVDENMAEINGILSEKDVNDGTVDAVYLPARNVEEIGGKLSAVDCLGDQNVVINGKSSSENSKAGANNVGCLISESVAEINRIPSNMDVNDGSVDATSLAGRILVEISGKFCAENLNVSAADVGPLVPGDRHVGESGGKSNSMDLTVVAAGVDSLMPGSLNEAESRGNLGSEKFETCALNVDSMVIDGCRKNAVQNNSKCGSEKVIQNSGPPELPRCFDYMLVGPSNVSVPEIDRQTGMEESSNFINLEKPMVSQESTSKLPNTKTPFEGMDVNVPKRLPPRRIPCHRDFPLGCGRSTPLLSDDERKELVILSRKRSAEDPTSIEMKTNVNTEYNANGSEAKIAKRTDEQLPGESVARINRADDNNEQVIGYNQVVLDIDKKLKDEDTKENSERMMFHDKVSGNDESNDGSAMEVVNSSVFNVKMNSRISSNSAISAEGEMVRKKLPRVGMRASSSKYKSILKGTDDSLLNTGEERVYDQGLIPSGSNPSCRSDSEDALARIKVTEILHLFRKFCSECKTSKSNSQTQNIARVDLAAVKILKEKKKFVNPGPPILGPVPGVEVGDEFHYRVELAIVGLHRPYQSGIDYTKQGQTVLATSVVASGGYTDAKNSDVLIYSGQGGKPMGASKKYEDQKLERGNLALKNSVDAKTPVRVIHGFKELSSDSQDAKAKMSMTFVYDGLYLVEKYWLERGEHGYNVFKFQMKRMQGQTEIAIKDSETSKKEDLCLVDISLGKEKIPVFVANSLDNDCPSPFEYITNMIYPSWYKQTPPEGCDCIGGCLDSKKCLCVMKNGGGIPFNQNGAIIEARSLVYECGPSCKCPPSCYNRVSQHGIRFQLETFKTKSRGWGVRSLTSIPSGSFICEYAGELLKDTEAEQRTGHDEYLFDIGNHNNEQSIRGGLSDNIATESQSCAYEKVSEDVEYTIDAFKYGNVGRFINHSCSPNLYAQNVLYDHDDKRMPHIMLFAFENIPRLQELTYDYNYKIGQVHDSNGNEKQKNCYCGSPHCTGRLY